MYQNRSTAVLRLAPRYTCCHSCRQVARRLAPDEYTAGRSPGSRKALDAEVGQQSLPEHCDTLRDIVTVLWAHQQLGFCPCQQLLAGTCLSLKMTIHKFQNPSLRRTLPVMVMVKCPLTTPFTQACIPYRFAVMGCTFIVWFDGRGQGLRM